MSIPKVFISYSHDSLDHKMNKQPIILVNLYAIAFTIGIASLSGCASGPPGKNVVDNKINLAKAGVVAGTMFDKKYGSYLEFINTENNETVSYVGAKDVFYLTLPPGEYEIAKIGVYNGPAGPIGDPFKFRVESGSITYIGGIYPGCGKVSTNIKVYARLNCGIFALGKCTPGSYRVPMCVIDDESETINEIKKLHPYLDNVPVKSSIMK